MTFQKGANWIKSGGNANGRPSDFRVEITKDFINRNWHHSQDIVDKLIGHAKKDKQWAIKLYLQYVFPYGLTKAPSQLEVSDIKDNKELENIFSKLSSEQSDILYNVLSGKVDKDKEQNILKIIKGSSSKVKKQKE